MITLNLYLPWWNALSSSTQNVFLVNCQPKVTASVTAAAKNIDSTSLMKVTGDALVENIVASLATADSSFLDWMVHSNVITLNNILTTAVNAWPIKCLYPDWTGSLTLHH